MRNRYLESCDEYEILPQETLQLLKKIKDTSSYRTYAGTSPKMP